MGEEAAICMQRIERVTVLKKGTPGTDQHGV